MNIILPTEQQKWLEAEVAAGRFASIDEALAAAVADLMAAEEDDLAWAKPYVDEARAAIARGEHISLDEFRAEIHRTIAKLAAS
jgi:antitoxin ParD1/3/4